MPTTLDRIAFCVTGARQSSLLLWEITDLVAPFIKGVKYQVSSGFGRRCCRMGEQDGAGELPWAAACSSSLGGCLHFLHVYTSVGKNMLKHNPCR